MFQASALPNLAPEMPLPEPHVPAELDIRSGDLSNSGSQHFEVTDADMLDALHAITGKIPGFFCIFASLLAFLIRCCIVLWAVILQMNTLYLKILNAFEGRKAVMQYALSIVQVLVSSAGTLQDFEESMATT
jgi:hypothetical protein